MVTNEEDGGNMAAVFETLTCLLRVFEVINVSGMSFTSVRSIRHFLTGKGQSSSVAIDVENDNKHGNIQHDNNNTHVGNTI